MARYLTEADVQKLLTMPLALQWMEEAHRALGEQRAIDVPRARIHLPTGTQHVLQAAVPELKVIGFKYYYTRPTGKSFYVHLMNTETAKSDRQITLYESHGMGLQDVYVGAKILALARACGIGQDMSIGG